MKIGVYSGSFDPFHNGHLTVAHKIAEATDLDKVMIVISKLNPFKQDKLPQEDVHRLHMAKIATSKDEKIIVSDIELGLPSPSYTYNTLKKLKETYPQHDFTLIIGSDNWNNFREWYEHSRIISEFGVIIYPRPGYATEANPPENVKILDNFPMTDISSTKIREKVKNNKDISPDVPPEIKDYIDKKKLYKT